MTMTHSPRCLLGLLSALGAMAVCGCSAAAASGPAAASQDRPGASSALAVQLQQQIGDAPCSSDDQCHTVAWGEKACGGPERWVAWSTQTIDAKTVNDLARRLAEARKADHLRAGAVSTCLIQADPGARCVAQHCRLNDGSAPAAAVSQ
jgi:hypothetical protein